MRPKTPDSAHPSVVPNLHASGPSKLVKPPLVLARLHGRQPVFSDESSETEYSSSSAEGGVHENGNCVESKLKDAPIQASTTVALSSISNRKMENLAIPQQGSPLTNSCVKDGIVLNGQTTAARPSTSIPGVGTKCTPFKERLEIKNGKEIVVVDLDSDEETDAPLTETLCVTCQHEHVKQQKQSEPKAADNETVHTLEGTLVVELSGILSQTNHAHIQVGEPALLQKSGTPRKTPGSSKAESSMDFSKGHMKTVSVNNLKHVEAEMDVRREHVKTFPLKAHGKQAMDCSEKMKTVALDINGKQAERVMDFSKEQIKTVALKSNGKQAETVMDFSTEQIKTVVLKSNGKQAETVMDFSKEQIKTVSNGKQTEIEISKEHIKTAMESSLKPLVGFSPEALRISTERLRETVFSAVEESEDEASTLSEDYRRGLADEHRVEVIRPDWSHDVLCDLCERGPSLSLGAWYSWCCGNPSLICKCSYEDQLRKKKTLKCKGGKSWKANDPPYPWSGKVHKLCGLWSAEVFEDSTQPWRIMKLWAAVQRSRKSKCSDPDCGLFGATLGCRVASCKKNFHYPCADKLSVLVKVRMWDGLMKPIACKDHRDVDDVLDDVKIQKEKSVFTKKRKRGGKKGLLASPGAGSSKLEMRTSGSADVINLESSGEDSPYRPTAQEVIPRLNTPPNDISRFPFSKSPDSWPDEHSSEPKPLGKNLLCKDFSGGLEPIDVPCTNDVDTEPPPYLEYITKSRYKGEPLGSRKHSHPLLERKAKACDGCALHDPDDPFAPVSIHIPFERREDDFREDWLRERMYGRLPYDKYARLVIGTDYNELVECNDRCKCGDSCINREMQKGLRTPIELYKTVNKGWAVRTLVRVPRGRFVIEYVGEMLTQDQAQKYGQIYDGIKRSYLYDLDYPESKRTPDFTLDGFHASNVGRFINHSCDANLKIYRVYVESTYKWLSHIGMYAMRDIEAGEELSYDYNYGRHDLQLHDGHSHNPEGGKQKMDEGSDSRHIKCHCGAKNCREWLWRPMHTGDESEEE